MLTGLTLLVLGLSNLAGTNHAAAAELSKADLMMIASSTASLYHLNQEHFLAVINCESHWEITAVGDKGLSHGLAQIYGPAHKEVTLEMSNDPFFSIAWMAKMWSEGKQNLWSCNRELYGP